MNSPNSTADSHEHASALRVISFSVPPNLLTRQLRKPLKLKLFRAEQSLSGEWSFVPVHDEMVKNGV